MDKDAIPIVNSTIDINNLSITPQDAFIFSRIDGKISIEDLCNISGIGDEKTMESILRLKEKGIIIFKNSDENINLTTEERNNIDSFYKHIDNSDYYEILGINKSADVKEIKKRYFELSKRFHPDRFFRKSLGDYKKKLDGIFNKITEAYDILSEEAFRKEYDVSIGGYGNITKEEVRDKIDNKEPIRVKSLKEFIEERVSKGKRYYEIAVSKFNKKNIKEAKNNIMLAISFDPWNKEYKEFLNNIEIPGKKKEAKELYDLGIFKENTGEYKEGIEYLERAVSLDPDNPQYFHDLSKMTSVYLKDYHKAKDYCLNALKIDPDNSEYHTTLGIVYKSARLFKNAIREFKKALELNKNNFTAQEGLKELEKEV